MIKKIITLFYKKEVLYIKTKLHNHLKTKFISILSLTLLNIITKNYQTSTFSVTIPKTISLNGLTYKCNYNVKVNGTFYYNDTLIVTPSSSFTLKDRSDMLIHLQKTI